MRRLTPALCLSGLLLACAHDQREQHARAEQSAGEERGDQDGADRTRQAAAAEPAHGAEPVELKRRGDPGRVAGVNSVPDRDPSNSEVNDRDRDGAAITPMDQGNGEIDLDLTQRIRKGVVADDSLSFSAKNVKIITRDGHVTLRGTVNSASEKETIYKTAVSHAGVGHVTNELEIDD